MAANNASNAPQAYSGEANGSGELVGLSVGVVVGFIAGVGVGESVGLGVGVVVGEGVGDGVGVGVGVAVGVGAGVGVGDTVGAGVVTAGCEPALKPFFRKEMPKKANMISSIMKNIVRIIFQVDQRDLPFPDGVPVISKTSGSEQAIF